MILIVDILIKEEDGHQLIQVDIYLKSPAIHIEDFSRRQTAIVEQKQLIIVIMDILGLHILEVFLVVIGVLRVVLGRSICI